MESGRQQLGEGFGRKKTVLKKSDWQCRSRKLGDDLPAGTTRRKLMPSPYWKKLKSLLLRCSLATNKVIGAMWMQRMPWLMSKLSFTVVV